MQKLDKNLLRLVKLGFVPNPGGQGEPVAGASPMTAAMGNPMGGDPSQGGGDPSMQGGDPSQGGGMPPAGLDPAMAGMMGGGMPADPNAAGGEPMPTMITLSIDDLIRMFEAFGGGKGKSKGTSAPAEAAPSAQPAGDPRLDHIITLLQQKQGQ